MTEAAERRPRPEVTREVLETRSTMMFELEAGDPSSFVDQVAEHLSTVFPNAGSLVVELGGGSASGRLPLHLVHADRVLKDSHVFAGDQVTRFKINRARNNKLVGFNLYDEGAPYFDNPYGYTIPESGLPTFDTPRDGVVSVDFDRAGIAYVEVTGVQQGSMVLAATAYLLGVKAGQETPH